MLGVKSHAPASGALMALGVSTNTGSTKSAASVFLSAGQQGYHLSRKFCLMY